LIQKTQSVTHTAVSHTGKYPGGGFIQVDIFLVSDKLESAGNVLLADAAKRETLTAGEDGCRNFVQLRGSQDK
jgi:hypothetical protein